MRLSTDADRDEELAFETIAAAAAAGVTVFDTARAYGDNERLLARALRRCGAERSARIVTKGGMTRAGGGWVPDGRASAILSDCEASLDALDGLAIDLYLIHAPDPRTPWRTSVRALARLLDEGLVRRVGVANVSRPQLDEARQLIDITAVQIGPLSAWRAAPGRQPRWSPRADRDRRGPLCNACRDSARLAARPLSHRGCHPGSPAPRDRALGWTSCGARLASRRPRSPGAHSRHIPQGSRRARIAAR